MQNIEIPIPADVECSRIELIIDLVIAENDLSIQMRAPLKKFPGCVPSFVLVLSSTTGLETCANSQT